MLSKLDETLSLHAIGLLARGFVETSRVEYAESGYAERRFVLGHVALKAVYERGLTYLEVGCTQYPEEFAEASAIRDLIDPPARGRWNLGMRAAGFLDAHWDAVCDLLTPSEWKQTRERIDVIERHGPGGGSMPSDRWIDGRRALGVDDACRAPPKRRRLWLPVVLLSLAFTVWYWPRLTPTFFPNAFDWTALALLVPGAFAMARYCVLPGWAFVVYGALGAFLFLFANFNDNNFRANTDARDVVLPWCAMIVGAAVLSRLAAFVGRAAKRARFSRR